MSQLDLQQICRALMEHRQSVFRTTHAFLSGNRDADSAPQFGEAAQVSSGQRLLGIGNAEAGKLAQDQSRLDEGIRGVAVHPDHSVISDYRAHGAHARDIFLLILLADLDLEDGKALFLELAGAHTDLFRVKIQSQSPREIDSAAIGSAEKATEWNPIDLAKSVKQSRFDCRLRDRVAIANPLQFDNSGADLVQVHADERRRKVSLRHEHHRL